MPPLVSFDGDVDLYRFPAVDRLGFTTFVSGRGGGISPVPFDSLNTTAAGGDDPANVTENLRRIRATVGIDHIWAPDQVHGDHIALVAIPGQPTVTADAVIALRPGLPVAVRTADCLPVLLADPVSGLCAAIHAGRAGVELGIARSAVETMVAAFNVEAENIVAALAPAIRSCCYEVDPPAARRFADCCGAAHVTGRHVDIVTATTAQLTDVGVAADRIHDAAICSACARDRFFSHRADGGRTGRFMTGIVRAP